MDQNPLPFGLHADPIDSLLSQRQDAVLAIIVGVEGPSYRPVGAMMTVLADGRHIGTLSSGCIEADIVLHALETLKTGRPVAIRYGRGSPFVDIRLPCGGGLDILLVPRPDRDTLVRVAERRHARIPCTLHIRRVDGAMSLHEHGATGGDETTFHVRFIPEVRFLIFGKGPEAGTFAALTQSAGYPNILLSPDHETLEHAADAGCTTRHLTTRSFPDDLEVDAWTAIVLFFHDHDWEPPILAGAVTSQAFYIGAQGSRQSRAVRDRELDRLGVDVGAISRIRGPIGLVPSARDARTLAISVLAEVLAASS